MKHLIISLDLSFKSTGITIVKLDNKEAKEICFYRVLFDAELNKKKPFTPKKISNINNVVYQMPKFLRTDDFIIDTDDENNVEQCEATLKAMVCAKNIKDVINKHCITDDYDFIIFCIENYIMPDFGGRNQLKTVSGLIMLQGFVREHIIRKYANSKKIKLLTPSPKTVKSFFANNGRADKEQMVEAFIRDYDGIKLIPDITKVDISETNDVVDSFALAFYAYNYIINNTIRSIEIL